MSVVIEGLALLAKAAKSFISKHVPEIITGSIVLAVSGTAATICASCKNKKAIAMVDEAVEKYTTTKNGAQDAINRLGEFKLEVYASFDDFVKEIEKIKDPPVILKKDISKIVLPDINLPISPKKLDAKAQAVIAGGEGMVSGTVIGVALFGIQGVALVPGVAIGGLFVCVKGFSLFNKSVNNMKDAETLCSDIEREITYLSDMKTHSNQMKNSIENVHRVYKSHITEIQSFLKPDTYWRTLSSREKRVIRNTVMLTKLLLEMCGVEVLKRNEETSKNQINTNEIMKIRTEATIVVDSIVRFEKTKKNKGIKLGNSSETKKLRLGRVNKKTPPMPQNQKDNISK